MKKKTKERIGHAIFWAIVLVVLLAVVGMIAWAIFWEPEYRSPIEDSSACVDLIPYGDGDVEFDREEVALNITNDTTEVSFTFTLTRIDENRTVAWCERVSSYWDSERGRRVRVYERMEEPLIEEYYVDLYSPRVLVNETDFMKEYRNAVGWPRMTWEADKLVFRDFGYDDFRNEWTEWHTDRWVGHLYQIDMGVGSVTIRVTLSVNQTWMQAAFNETGGVAYGSISLYDMNGNDVPYAPDGDRLDAALRLRFVRVD